MSGIPSSKKKSGTKQWGSTPEQLAGKDTQGKKELASAIRFEWEIWRKRVKATEFTSHFCVMALFGTLYSIHMHIDFELLTAFSYTGSPKTDQGGDNQARHVVSKLMNPEPAC